MWTPLRVCVEREQLDFKLRTDTDPHYSIAIPRRDQYRPPIQTWLGSSYVDLEAVVPEHLVLGHVVAFGEVNLSLEVKGLSIKRMILYIMIIYIGLVFQQML